MAKITGAVLYQNNLTGKYKYRFLVKLSNYRHEELNQEIYYENKIELIALLNDEQVDDSFTAEIDIEQLTHNRSTHRVFCIFLQQKFSGIEATRLFTLAGGAAKSGTLNTGSEQPDRPYTAYF